MPKKRTPSEWLKEIEEGLEYRRRFGLEDLWASFEGIYYNVDGSMLNDGPNIFLSQGDAMLSTITVPSSRVRVYPTKPEEVDKAPIVESLDNALIRETNLSVEVETATLHAYLFGRGILKIGYDSEWGYDPTYDVGGVLRLGFTLTQLDRKGKKRIEYDAQISPGSPWVRAVDPRDFVIPWGIREIDEAPWVAHRVVRHIADLKADRRYNTARVTPMMSMQDFVESYRSTIKGKIQKSNTKEPEYVELYEIHDRETGKIYVVTWDHDSFLREETNALQIENRLPFVSMGFTPRTRAFWTTPDVYYLYHIQNELSDVARQRTKQRRLSTLKFLYDSDAISEEELQKLLSPDVGAAAKIESGQEISRAILKLDNVPNQVLAQEEDLLRANAREQIGFSRNQLGEYTGGRKTAREVATVDRASQLRMSRRGVIVKRLYEDVIRTMNNIVFSYWTMPRYVSAIGTELAERWVQVNGPALRGRYDYRCEFVDDAELESRKLEALNLYGVLAQDPSVDPIELRKYLTNQVNDPAFERLFSASVRRSMPEMSDGSGTVLPSANGGARPLSQRLQGGASETPQSDAARLLAGGRNRS